MRIAFDLDSTLIRDSDNFPLENKNLIQKLFFITGIRKDTKRIFSELKEKNHEIWIYTASYRLQILIKLLFLLYGLKLDGVVNQRKHNNRLCGNKIKQIKFPPKFNLDVLIDNSESVYQEGLKHNFKVIKISPNDIKWGDTVLQELNKSLA